MSSKAIVCAACGVAVPYGRLSCPSCGELLASVAGATRSLMAATSGGRANGVATATKRPSRAARASAPAPAVLLDVEPVTELAPEPPIAAPEPPMAAPEAWGAAPAPATFQPAEAEPPRHDAPPPRAGDGPHWAEERPEWPGDRPAWRDERQPAPPTPPFADATAATAGTAGTAVAPASVTSPSLGNAPGAYVPPVLPVEPAGPPAPARAWAGHAVDTEAQATTGTSAKAAAEALLDPARLPEFIGWLAVAGSAMAAAGFVLPWGRSVIGASGVDFFDRWGLAGPFHPIVVLGLLAVLGLAMIPNPVPLWVRIGLPGLGLGALLLGLVWPYLLYLPGTGPGVVVVAIGALILLVAGIVALATDRHARVDRGV